MIANLCGKKPPKSPVVAALYALVQKRDPFATSDQLRIALAVLARMEFAAVVIPADTPDFLRTLIRRSAVAADVLAFLFHPERKTDRVTWMSVRGADRKVAARLKKDVEAELDHDLGKCPECKGTAN